MSKKTLFNFNRLADPPFCGNKDCTQGPRFDGLDTWHPAKRGSLRYLCHRFHNTSSPFAHLFTFPRCYVKARNQELQMHPPEVPSLPAFLNLHSVNFAQHFPHCLLCFFNIHLHLQGCARVTNLTMDARPKRTRTSLLPCLSEGALQMPSQPMNIFPSGPSAPLSHFMHTPPTHSGLH